MKMSRAIKKHMPNENEDHLTILLRDLLRRLYSKMSYVEDLK